MKKNRVLMRVDANGKKVFKELAAELDSSMIDLSSQFGDIKQELKELFKRKKKDE